MDAYVELVLAFLASVAARDWAVAAALLFALVLVLRLVRIVARPAQVPPAAQRAPAAPVADTISPPPAAVRAPDPAPRSDTRPRVALPPAAQAGDGPSPLEVSRALSQVRFEGKSMMKWQEYCLLRDVEGLLTRLGKGHRLFCHVALTEFFTGTGASRSTELTEAVDRALAPYRADFLIVDRQGYPAMGLAFATDSPVVRTVFRQAGLPFLSVRDDYSWPLLEREVVHGLNSVARPLPKTA